MVLGSLTKYLIYGLVAAFAITSLAQPSRAYAATQVFGGVGSSLSSLGTGIKDFLTGTGTGVSQLFNPLWTLRDLIYGPAAGQQAALDVREETTTGNIETSQQAIQASEVLQTNPETLINPAYQSPPFAFSNLPSISPAPVAPSVVHGQTLPLSQAAIDHYQSLGVSVSPANSQTVASRNNSNANAPSTQATSAASSANAPSSASVSSSVSANGSARGGVSVRRGTSRYSRR
jgi:hypothetical protein